MSFFLLCCRYASEVDVDFVRKSIKAIGQTAIKIDAAAERCVHVLLDLIDTRVSYVVQEAVVVMKASFFLFSVHESRLIYIACRIFSENIHQRMRVSYPLFVRILTNWMSQRPRLPSFGSLENTPTKLIMQTSFWVSLLIPSRKSLTLYVHLTPRTSITRSMWC